ncbi:hypothetical protein IAU59_002592 [Kwoniella sp. CBS 9459]
MKSTDYSEHTLVSDEVRRAWALEVENNDSLIDDTGGASMSCGADGHGTAGDAALQSENTTHRSTRPDHRRRETDEWLESIKRTEEEIDETANEALRAVQKDHERRKSFLEFFQESLKRQQAASTAMLNNNSDATRLLDSRLSGSSSQTAL